MDRDWTTGRVAGNVHYNFKEPVVLSDYLIVSPGLEDFGEFTLRNEASVNAVRLKVK